MRNPNDSFLLEKTIEHSTYIFGLCNQLPENEPTIIHFLKESAINQSAYLNQAIHSTSNEETIFYFDNAWGTMYRMKTIFDLLFRLNYINSHDLSDFNEQLDTMIDIINKRTSRLEDEIEKERLNFSMCLPEIFGPHKNPGGRRQDS